MRTEMERLGGLGWDMTASPRHGVHFVGGIEEPISYPTGVLNTLAAEGGGGFWLDARAREVASVLNREGVKTLWDVGAGSGAMAKRLIPLGIDVISVEPLPEGAQEIAKINGATVFCGTLEALGLPDDSLTAIGLFDVLEHLAKPQDLLNEVHRVLRPGGIAIATVPAYPWLWSAEDIALGHFRRYTRKTLTIEFGSASFRVLEMRSLFASLVPLSAGLRALPYRLTKTRSKEQSLNNIGSALAPPAVIDQLAALVLNFEHLLARKFELPFGLSLLVVASKGT